MLLLKEGAPQNDPASRRPITLLNTDYKILATIINHPIKLLLPMTITPHQACAVPGRSIFTNLTITRDVFEFASKKGLSGAFLSLDQSKAYDRVRHLYLFEVLREFGFPPAFVKLIELLYSDLTCSVVVNGSMTPPLQV